jgi:16S rRNA processing protein RimM
MSEDYHYPEDEYLLIGKIGKPHGLQGDVKVICYSGQPDNVLDYKELFLVKREGVLSPPLDITKARVQGKGAVVSLRGVESRNQAEEIQGAGILIAIDELPAVEEDEFYWHQFIGRQLLDLAGTRIGSVTSLFSNGAQDILVVTADTGEILIPVTKEIIVGESDESLTIDPPPGLLEMNINSSE